MKQKNAQFIFIGFNLLTCCAIIFLAYDTWRIYNEINQVIIPIEFDNGQYYLILMTAFWVLYGIQWAGLRTQQFNLRYSTQSLLDKMAKFIHQKHLPILIFWFTLCLLLANILPYVIEDKLIQAGYIPCKNTRAISPVSKGHNYLYSKNDC
ncbi:hypothetical protein [Aliikangiella maris]|uniref:RDD family protein n=2 Tax=Aliikangiella maris TaxID=3162458 RepID=A0ABV2BST0_9GAMM